MWIKTMRFFCFQAVSGVTRSLSGTGICTVPEYVLSVCFERATSKYNFWYSFTVWDGKSSSHYPLKLGGRRDLMGRCLRLTSRLRQQT